MRRVLDPQIRAEMLRIGHMLASGAPDLDPREYADVPGGNLELRDLIVLSAMGEDELALLNTCLLAEHELREREFAALERLLALTQWWDGPLDERLRALPMPAFSLAVMCLLQLGWDRGDA